MASLSALRYDEIAVPRILDVFRRFGIKQTFFYPAWCMEQYPHLVDAILQDGHEIAAHGYLHENANRLQPEDELYWLQRQIAVIEKMTGQRPRGWRAPRYNMSSHSLDYLLDEGLRYDASLMGDDVPYVLRSGGRELLELPSHWALDDWPQYMYAPDFQYRSPVKSPPRRGHPCTSGRSVTVESTSAAWARARNARDISPSR